MEIGENLLLCLIICFYILDLFCLFLYTMEQFKHAMSSMLPEHIEGAHSHQFEDTDIKLECRLPPQFHLNSYFLLW